MSNAVQVSMQLEIWGRQAETVRRLVDKTLAGGDDPGPIVQSNMGEGKTRVMLPMMVLDMARQAGTDERKVPRLVFLDALLPDAVDHLHRTLTGAPAPCAPRNSCLHAFAPHAAHYPSTLFLRILCQTSSARGVHHAGSALGVPLYQLPFSRDVSLDGSRVARMHAVLERCRASGGFLCIAREHRASLLLKQQARPPVLLPHKLQTMFPHCPESSMPAERAI